MSIDYEQFEKRKRDHIDLALMTTNQAQELNTLDHIQLTHEALPELNFEDLSLESMRLGALVKSPFFVSSMTAGHRDAVDINYNLIQACAESGWAMGVGSQRRELSDPHAAEEWFQIRKQFPDVVLYSNLGISQLITSSHQQIHELTDALSASALIVHLNPLQESIQPEGTPQFKGGLEALESITATLGIPVIVKETGCGFSKNTLLRLKDTGIKAVDVSGLGGTHWGRIEGHRAALGSTHKSASEAFKNWGITTVQSVLNAKAINPDYEIWASGGVRHGLDAAKLLALGATQVGFAKPMLLPALESAEKVVHHMNTIEYELKVAMFCTGSKLPSELKEKACL